MFRIGDRVVCIDASKIGPDTQAPPEGYVFSSAFLRAGREYKIRDTKVCECGNLLVDVGADYTHTYCGRCNDPIRGAWFFQWRFVKLDGLLTRDEVIEAATDPEHA